MSHTITLEKDGQKYTFTNWEQVHRLVGLSAKYLRSKWFHAMKKGIPPETGITYNGYSITRTENNRSI